MLEMGDHGDYTGLRVHSFPDPWFVIEHARRSVFVAELAAEVGKGHPLYGVRAIPVAQCGGCDRIVFSMEAPPSARWAVVHLTWSRRTEPLPWPTTVVFDDVPPLRQALEGHEH